jgi:hypothetical protein
MLLPESMAAFDGLVLHGRIPPPVEQKNVVSRLQVQADPAYGIIQQHYLVICILLKLFYYPFPLARLYFAVKLQNPGLLPGGFGFSHELGQSLQSESFINEPQTDKRRRTIARHSSPPLTLATASVSPW